MSGRPFLRALRCAGGRLPGWIHHQPTARLVSPWWGNRANSVRIRRTVAGLASAATWVPENETADHLAGRRFETQ